MSRAFDSYFHKENKHIYKQDAPRLIEQAYGKRVRKFSSMLREADEDLGGGDLGMDDPMPPGGDDGMGGMGGMGGMPPGGDGGMGGNDPDAQWNTISRVIDEISNQLNNLTAVNKNGETYIAFDSSMKGLQGELELGRKNNMTPEEAKVKIDAVIDTLDSMIKKQGSLANRPGRPRETDIYQEIVDGLKRLNSQIIPTPMSDDPSVFGADEAGEPGDIELPEEGFADEEPEGGGGEEKAPTKNKKDLPKPQPKPQSDRRTLKDLLS